MDKKQTLRVGVGGPVGSGKTALLKSLCLSMRDAYNIAVVTNDIYTKEDAKFLTENEALFQKDPFVNCGNHLSFRSAFFIKKNYVHYELNVLDIHVSDETGMAI